MPSPASTPRAAPTPRLAVLLSGSGRTLLNLIERINRGELQAQIPLVIASRECLGAARARELGIETLIVKGDIPAETLASTLVARRIDWVVLAGYLRFVNVPPTYRGRIVNIHPSLLPAFGGPGMYGDRVHAAVLAAAARESGCTVHFVDDQYDTGPIIAQQCVPVLPGDDVHTLAARVFEAECELYPRALQLVTSGRVTVDGQPQR